MKLSLSDPDVMTISIRGALRRKCNADLLGLWLKPARNARNPIGTRPAWGRLQALIAKAELTGGLPNGSDLAKEFDCSTKTIQRDLRFLRKNYGLPIRYDDLTWSYVLDQETKPTRRKS